MNSLQKLKKEIAITDILNIQTEKEEVFIKSPFREEKTPSFKINTTKNIWFDFGIGKGGSNIDLVMLLKNCNIKEAINFLKNTNSPFSFSPVNISNISASAVKSDSNYKINKVQELQNKALISYLNNRKIDIEIAKKYCKEIYYFLQDKHYFAVAFKNNSKDGYEIRNKYFKGCINKKEITTIENNSSNSVILFEGFFDFLSFLTYFKKDRLRHNVIILNSLSMLENLDLSNYKKIYTFLDNDEAGIDATNNLFAKYKNIINCSNLYKNFKDFNDFIIKYKFH